MTDLATLLACPRCDKSPLEREDGQYHCTACKVYFPSINGIPWMFAEPQATLGEWRGRLAFAMQKIGHEIAGLEKELKKDDLHSLTRRRVERYKKAVEDHRRRLSKLLKPIDIEANFGSYESYLALRTRLPADQGLNTYYANIHRDWSWGDEENSASLKQIQS
ncbi:MAG: Trm112 family protein, partial [Woeseiaceae bacterium]